MTGHDTHYPVRVDAVLDPPVSRWLWLVKWVLLIPHVIVLAFLWVAFVVVSVLAFFAILINGRYPRALFDFNVGVLRWTWRVQYYSYAALGTDRYPPFTLSDVPDYPAHLEVPHPERLSRGLVLVKWWLLALPHYLVVGVFAGGGLWLSSAASERNDGWGLGGLIGLLVLVAGVVLLFTGRYPARLYDFVLGMDRWVLRVAAYAALMTDRYPPFQLDMGGTDPGSRPVDPPATTPAGATSAAHTAASPAGSTATAAPAPSSRWTAGRVVAVVLGAVLLLASTAPLFGGGALLWADRTQRTDGWLTSPQATASTQSFALVSDGVTLDTSGADWVVDDLLGRVRLQVTPQDGAAVFVGVAPTSAVDQYLAGVGRTRMDSLGGQRGWNQGGMGSGMGGGYRMGPEMMTEFTGGPPATAPGDTDIWTASVEGAGTQTLEWTPADGDWTLVVMPTDRSAGLSATLGVAATAPGLGWLAGGLMAVGAVLLVVGVLLLVLAVHRTRAEQLPPAAGDPAPDGDLPPPVVDPRLSPSSGAR